jgi:hypothetical protein
MSTAISIDRTRARFDKTEAETLNRLGFPRTTAGRAVINKYAGELAGIIGEARATRHGNAAAAIWDTLSEFSDENLAINILAIALQANHEDDLIGSGSRTSVHNSASVASLPSKSACGRLTCCVSCRYSPEFCPMEALSST